MTIYYTAKDRTPYVYLIGWSKYNKWYYGVRYAKQCHPSELWITYKTSSKVVKTFYEENGNPDIIQIRKIFRCIDSARMWEHKVLKRMNVIKDTKWLNQTDNISILLDEEIKQSIAQKISKSLKGRRKSDIHKLNLSVAKIGQKPNISTSGKIKMLEISHTKEANIKRHNTMVNKIWINDGNIELRININDPLPEEFKRGRLKSSRIYTDEDRQRTRIIGLNNKNKRLGKNNPASKQISFKNKIYDTIRQACKETGLSEYLVKKYGKIL